MSLKINSAQNHSTDNLSRTVMLNEPVRFFVPFTEVARGDNSERIVEGYCYTKPKVRGDKWNLKRAALERASQKYMQIPCIRVMHQPVAAGKGISIHWDDKGCLLRAEIVDDNEWNKVVKGVYRGFSIGGKPIVARGSDIEEFDWVETSLVDRPCDDGAVFTTLSRVAEISGAYEVQVLPEDESAGEDEEPLERAEDTWPVHELDAAPFDDAEGWINSHGLERMENVLDFELELLRAQYANGYDPDQPRDKGGRWTIIGGHSVSIHGAKVDHSHVDTAAKRFGLDEDATAKLKAGIDSGKIKTDDHLLRAIAHATDAKGEHHQNWDAAIDAHGDGGTHDGKHHRKGFAYGGESTDEHKAADAAKHAASAKPEGEAAAPGAAAPGAAAPAAGVGAENAQAAAPAAGAPAGDAAPAAAKKSPFDYGVEAKKAGNAAHQQQPEFAAEHLQGQPSADHVKALKEWNKGWTTEHLKQTADTPDAAPAGGAAPAAGGAPEAPAAGQAPAGNAAPAGAVPSADDHMAAVGEHVEDFKQKVAGMTPENQKKFGYDTLDWDSAHKAAAEKFANHNAENPKVALQEQILDHQMNGTHTLPSGGAPAAEAAPAGAAPQEAAGNAPESPAEQPEEPAAPTTPEAPGEAAGATPEAAGDSESASAPGEDAGTKKPKDALDFYGMLVDNNATPKSEKLFSTLDAQWKAGNITPDNAQQVAAHIAKFAQADNSGATAKHVHAGIAAAKAEAAGEDPASVTVKQTKTKLEELADKGIVLPQYANKQAKKAHAQATAQAVAAGAAGAPAGGAAPTESAQPAATPEASSEAPAESSGLHPDVPIAEGSHEGGEPQPVKPHGVMFDFDPTGGKHFKAVDEAGNGVMHKGEDGSYQSSRFSNMDEAGEWLKKAQAAHDTHVGGGSAGAADAPAADAAGEAAPESTSGASSEAPASTSNVGSAGAESSAGEGGTEDNSHLLTPDAASDYLEKNHGKPFHKNYEMGAYSEAVKNGTIHAGNVKSVLDKIGEHAAGNSVPHIGWNGITSGIIAHKHEIANDAINSVASNAKLDPANKEHAKVFSKARGLHETIKEGLLGGDLPKSTGETHAAKWKNAGLMDEDGNFDHELAGKYKAALQADMAGHEFNPSLLSKSKYGKSDAGWMPTKFDGKNAITDGFMILHGDHEKALPKNANKNPNWDSMIQNDTMPNGQKVMDGAAAKATTEIKPQIIHHAYPHGWKKGDAVHNKTGAVAFDNGQQVNANSISHILEKFPDATFHSEGTQDSTSPIVVKSGGDNVGAVVPMKGMPMPANHPLAQADKLEHGETDELDQEPAPDTAPDGGAPEVEEPDEDGDNEGAENAGEAEQPLLSEDPEFTAALHGPFVAPEYAEHAADAEGEGDGDGDESSGEVEPDAGDDDTVERDEAGADLQPHEMMPDQYHQHVLEQSGINPLNPGKDDALAFATALKGAGGSHEQVVKSAVDNGQHVPMDVLKHYPHVRPAGKHSNGISEFTGQAPHTMTSDEFTAHYMDGVPAQRREALGKHHHQKFIAQAVQAGDTVPEKVLSEYPELQAEAAAKGKAGSVKRGMATTAPAFPVRENLEGKSPVDSRVKRVTRFVHTDSDNCLHRSKGEAYGCMMKRLARGEVDSLGEVESDGGMLYRGALAARGIEPGQGVLRGAFELLVGTLCGSNDEVARAAAIDAFAEHLHDISDSWTEQGEVMRGEVDSLLARMGQCPASRPGVIGAPFGLPTEPTKYADPVNFRLPIDTVERVENSWRALDGEHDYSKAELAFVMDRIELAAKALNVELPATGLVARVAEAQSELKRLEAEKADVVQRFETVQSDLAKVQDDLEVTRRDLSSAEGQIAELRNEKLERKVPAKYSSVQRRFAANEANADPRTAKRAELQRKRQELVEAGKAERDEVKRMSISQELIGVEYELTHL